VLRMRAGAVWRLGLGWGQEGVEVEGLGLGDDWEAVIMRYADRWLLSWGL
jgi:hypothetical protein